MAGEKFTRPIAQVRNDCWVLAGIPEDKKGEFCATQCVMSADCAPLIEYDAEIGGNPSIPQRIARLLATVEMRGNQIAAAEHYRKEALDKSKKAKQEGEK